MCWMENKEIFCTLCIDFGRGCIVMCRRNQLLGVALTAFGVGLLAASFFESGLFCGFVAVASIVAGICICQKN